MKGIAVAAAAGLLIASFVCPGTTRAQQSEPDAKAAKVTLKSVEAQVVTLQSQVATLQTTVSSLFPEDFAVVSATGALNRASASAVSASLFATGEYRVIFNKDVSGCAYVATIGDIGDNPSNPGEIAVQGISGDDDGVAVDTFDSTGTAVNSPFHLSLSCP